MLRGKNILLRSLEVSDLDFLCSVENDKLNWKYGSENIIYTREELKKYILNSRIDLSVAKQYRFVIDLEKNPIGFIDLFNYNADSVSLGVIIIQPYRRNSYAKESVGLILNYVFSFLGLVKVFATVRNDNLASINLFLSCNFQLEREDNDLKYFIKLAEK